MGNGSAENRGSDSGEGYDSSAVYYGVSNFKIIAAQGIRVTDDRGRNFIDCASATFNLSLGYGHPEVVAAVQRQAAEMIHVTSAFQTSLINELTHRLVALAPNSIATAHLKVSSGSVANEGAIKMAQRATGKRDVITLFRSHLGQTMAMTALSGGSLRRGPLVGGSAVGGLQVPDPYCHRCFYGQDRSTCGLMCVERIPDFIDNASSGSIAAVMVEPVSGNGGNIVVPDGYLTRLLAICREHGIKLIIDEIQTGMGRTGAMFASEHFGIEPDAITVGKGLGGSGLPIAGILASEELGGLPSHEHSFTNGANLLSAAGALATLDVMGRPGFLENVRSVGALILDRLQQLAKRVSFISDVRGLGLMLGFEIGHPGTREDLERAVALTNLIAERGLDFGLILRTSRYGRGNVIKIRPPLILTHIEASELCDRLEALIDACADDAERMLVTPGVVA